MNRTRRQVLAGCGAVGAVALAGCSSDGSDGDGGPNGSGSPTPTPTDPPESQFVTADLVVDYPGMVDGDATVDAGESAVTIRYRDPEQAFRLVSGFEGDTDPSELRVGRDLAVDARAGFVAPVHDGEAGEFVYQVFVNEAFVEYADWNFVSVDASGSLTQEGAVPFERAQGRVFAAGVRPGDVRRVFVVDRTAQSLREDGARGISGIVVLVDSAGGDTPTPTP